MKIRDTRECSISKTTPKTPELRTSFENDRVVVLSCRAMPVLFISERFMNNSCMFLCFVNVVTSFLNAEFVK